MNWYFGLITYILLWWVTIFCMLPYGAQAEETPETGNATSAPQNPRIKQKLIITSLVAGAVWLLIYLCFEMGWFSWDELARSYNKQIEW